MIQAIFTGCFVVGATICLVVAALIGTLGAFVAMRQGEYLPLALYMAFTIACCATLVSLKDSCDE